MFTKVIYTSCAYELLIKYYSSHYHGHKSFASYHVTSSNIPHQSFIKIIINS